MATVNSQQYTLSKVLEGIRIVKVGDPLNILEVQLSEINVCNNTKKDVLKLVVKDGVIIKIPFRDGLYRLRITYTTNFIGSSNLIDNTRTGSILQNPIIDVYEYFFISSETLLKNIAEDVYMNILNCGSCKDTSKCDDDKKIDNLSFKLLSYIILNFEVLKPYLSAINNCLQCDLIQVINCINTEKVVHGNLSVSRELKKRLILSLYYIIYIVVKFQNEASSDIDTFFKIDKNIGKIKLLGVNIDCINKAIMNIERPTFFNLIQK